MMQIVKSCIVSSRCVQMSLENLRYVVTLLEMNSHHVQNELFHKIFIDLMRRFGVDLACDELEVGLVQPEKMYKTLSRTFHDRVQRNLLQ